jgi:hypothetical protein
LARLLRHELRDLVDLGIRDVQASSRIAEDRPRRHRPERDDLRHVRAAVLPGDVVDDALAVAEAEIDVDVGHRDPLGVQEALEEKIELHRVDVGDPHAVGDERAGRRSAPGPDGNPLLAREPDEIPHDEEVAREPHVANHLDLARQALAVALDRMPEPPARFSARQRGRRLSKPSRAIFSKYAGTSKPSGTGKFGGWRAACRR